MSNDLFIFLKKQNENGENIMHAILILETHFVLRVSA